jgi:drug/metabolite transporter (DMT)-like permease
LKIALSDHAKGLLITAIGIIAISPDALLIRLISTDALTIVFWRGLFFSFGMFVLLSFYFKKKIINAFFEIGIPGLWMAVFYALGNLLFVYSFTHTAAANTLFILSTTPFWAALIAWLVFRERIPNRTWIAIVVAGIGIIIICLGKSVRADAYIGNIAGLMATATLAISFTIVARNRSKNLLPALVLGGFMTALILEPFVSPTTISDSDLGYLFLMGFVMLPLAGSLMFLGPKYLPAPEVSLLMLLESIFGPLWVWMVLNEYPGDIVIIGGAIILVTLSIHAYLGMRDTNKTAIVK